METCQLMVHELYWDSSIEEIFLTHYVGGSVCTAIKLQAISDIHDALVATKANSITLSRHESGLVMDERYSTLSVPASPSAVLRWKFLALVSIKRDPLGVQHWRTDTIVRFGFRHEVCSGWRVGEIFVSGPTVSLGYPEATAQFFMTDPFRKEFRMYRTGDFGCVNMKDDFTSLDFETGNSN
ncbi:hypothetical protein M404DRAFT_33536 [Pisolithus tinctorius Marx 270]|uniref:Uncharacterized protein n=1 Tax=Pisolithus tinctorius Marx 270 TaxID=870435 RepID=A0A0C3NLE0_PISTI|nr:hypothetical protein M404DRAFT_33536 [Pisolithus tinctorius Marx 270]